MTDLEIRFFKLNEANICNGGFLFTHYPLVPDTAHSQITGAGSLNNASEKKLYEVIRDALEKKALLVTEPLKQTKITQLMLELSKEEGKYLQVTYLGPWREASKEFLEEHKDVVPCVPAALWLLRRKDVNDN